jgi:hypothetical protein
MTHQQILEKAIQKASDGGWKRDYKVKFSFTNSDGSRRITARTTVDDWDTYAPIIFNHDFAKALWGEETTKRDTSGNYSPKGLTVVDNLGWQYHLQMMVIADDPIKYLGEHLDD